MEIKVIVESRAMGMFELKGKIMQSCDLGENKLVELIELPVKIFAAETCSEVAGHNSVGVEHGDNLEDEGRP